MYRTPPGAPWQVARGVQPYHSTLRGFEEPKQKRPAKCCRDKGLKETRSLLGLARWTRRRPGSAGRCRRSATPPCREPDLSYLADKCTGGRNNCPIYDSSVCMRAASTLSVAEAATTKRQQHICKVLLYRDPKRFCRRPCAMRRSRGLLGRTARYSRRSMGAPV